MDDIDEGDDGEATGKKRRHGRFKSERQLEKEEEEEVQRQTPEQAGMPLSKRARPSGGRGDPFKAMPGIRPGRGSMAGQVYGSSRMGPRALHGAMAMGIMGRAPPGSPLDLAIQHAMMPPGPFRPMDDPRLMQGQFKMMVQQHSSLSMNGGRGRGFMDNRLPPRMGDGPGPLPPPPELMGPGGPFRHRGMEMVHRDLHRAGPPLPPRALDPRYPGMGGGMGGPPEVRDRNFSSNGEGVLGSGGPGRQGASSMLMGGPSRNRANGGPIVPGGDSRAGGGLPYAGPDFAGPGFRAGLPASWEVPGRGREEDSRLRPDEVDRGLEERMGRRFGGPQASGAPGQRSAREEFGEAGRGASGAAQQRRSEEMKRRSPAGGRGRAGEHARPESGRPGSSVEKGGGYRAESPGRGDMRSGFHEGGGSVREQLEREDALRAELLAAQSRGRFPGGRRGDAAQGHGSYEAAPNNNNGHHGEGAAQAKRAAALLSDSFESQLQDRQGGRSLPRDSRLGSGSEMAGRPSGPDGERARTRASGPEQQSSRNPAAAAGGREGPQGGPSGSGNDLGGRGRGLSSEQRGGRGAGATRDERRGGRTDANAKVSASSRSPKRNHEGRPFPDGPLPPPPPLGAKLPQRISAREMASAEQGRDRAAGGGEASDREYKIVKLSRPVSPGRTVRVTGLAPTASPSTLLRMFEKQGRVAKCRVEASHFYVTFATSQGAVSAKRLLHRSMVGGKQITVEYAQS